MQLTDVWLLCQLVTKCDTCSSARREELLEVPHTWDKLVSRGTIPHRHQQQLENLNSNVLALTTEHVLI